MKIDGLNNRIDVYGKTEIKNELGETDYTYDKIKTIWANILPTTGSVRNVTGEVIRTEMKYKITIRSDSLKELTNDMYFIYKNQRYDIDYFIPNFKYRDSIEIYCSLVVE